MLGVGESSSPNFLISWSVMLEGQRAVTDRQDAAGVAGRKSSNHRIIVSSCDPSIPAATAVAVRQPSPIWVETPEEHGAPDWGISLAQK